jgi:hypothetical protein
MLIDNPHPLFRSDKQFNLVRGAIFIAAAILKVNVLPVKANWKKQTKRYLS